MSQAEKLAAQAVQERRKWSADLLGLPLQTTMNEARSRWLASLESSEFLPDETHWPAWQVYTSAEVAATAHQRLPLWDEAFDTATGHKIDEFAEEFWTLPIEERRKRFFQLFAASRDQMRLQARLAALSQSLNLPTTPDFMQHCGEPADEAAADVQRLALHLRALLVRTPSARGALQRAFFAEHRTESERWAAAAIRVRETHSDLASLLPRVVDEIAQWPVREVAAERFQQQQNRELRKKTVREEPIIAVKSNRERAGSMFESLLTNRYTALILILFVVKLISGLSRSGVPTRTSTNFSGPAPTIEDIRKKYLKQRQLEQLKQFEKNKSDRSWITMDEEEFLASGGPTEVAARGLAARREAYLAWQRRREEMDALLQARVNELDSKDAEVSTAQARLADIDQQEKTSRIRFPSFGEKRVPARERIDLLRSKIATETELRRLEAEQKALRAHVEELQLIYRGLLMHEPK